MTKECNLYKARDLAVVYLCMSNGSTGVDIKENKWVPTSPQRLSFIGKEDYGRTLAIHLVSISTFWVLC